MSRRDLICWLGALGIWLSRIGLLAKQSLGYFFRSADVKIDRADARYRRHPPITWVFAGGFERRHFRGVLLDQRDAFAISRGTMSFEVLGELIDLQTDLFRRIDVEGIGVAIGR